MKPNLKLDVGEVQMLVEAQAHGPAKVEEDISISARCTSLQANTGACSTCSALNSKVCTPVHCAPSAMPECPSGRDEQIDVARDVERANEEARNRKLLTKKLAIQPSLVGPTPAAEVADGTGASGHGMSLKTNLSKRACRRMEKKAKQRHAERRRDEAKQQRMDDEFRKVLKAVEPLRQESGTVVREDLETLESVKELDAVLRKTDKQAKVKPRRQPTEKEAELAHALLGTGQLRSKVHMEVKVFIKSFSGMAPDAETFAERLVEALLGVEAIKSHDPRTAIEVYGDFVEAFIGHGWSERRLRRVGRSVVLRAAALA